MIVHSPPMLTILRGQEKRQKLGESMSRDAFPMRRRWFGEHFDSKSRRWRRYHPLSDAKMQINSEILGRLLEDISGLFLQNI